MHIVDIIFTLLQCGLVIVFSWYLFRRYGYERIRQSLSSEQIQLLNLVKKHELLKKHEQSLTRCYYHQNMVYEELSRKIDSWRAQRDQEDAEQEAIGEKIAEHMERRAAQRARYTQEQLLIATIQKEAAAQADRELRGWFQQNQHAHQYEVMVCHDLERKHP